MSKKLQRYRPKQPDLVRVPRIFFPKNTPSVYSTRLFFLLAYHSKFIPQLEIPLTELGKALGIRNSTHLHSLSWWRAWLEADTRHASWLLAPILLIGEHTIEGFPLVQHFTIDDRTKNAKLILNPEARECLQDLSGGFTAIRYQELLRVTHPKASLAYVLFCSIEKYAAPAMRTYSFKDLTRALELNPTLSNSKKMEEVRRLAKVVERSTSMKVEIKTLKQGRDLTAVQFTIRRRIKIKSKFNLRAA